jgi:hypothetical protein
MKAAPGKMPVALPIACHVLVEIMLTAVDLNDQTRALTHKI